MQVKATRRGFYGMLIEPGMVFELADEKHLASWMEPVDPKDRERLAARMLQLNISCRPSAAPGVRPTTGPGFENSLRDPIQPKAEGKPEAQPAAAPKDKPAEKAPEKPAKSAG